MPTKCIPHTIDLFSIHIPAMKRCVGGLVFLGEGVRSGPPHRILYKGECGGGYRTTETKIRQYAPHKSHIFFAKLSGQNIGLQKVVDRLPETRPRVGHAEDLKQIRNIKHFT